MGKMLRFLGLQQQQLEEVTVAFPYRPGTAFGMELTDKHPGRLTITRVIPGGMVAKHLRVNDRIKSINGVSVGQSLHLTTDLHALVNNSPTVTAVVDRPVLPDANAAKVSTVTYNWNEIGDEEEVGRRSSG